MNFYIREQYPYSYILGFIFAEIILFISLNNFYRQKPCPNQEVGQLVPPGNPETSSFESNAPAAPLPPPPTAIVSASAPSPPPLHPTISSALGILPPPPPPLASATDPARYPSLALPPSRQLVPPPPHTTAPPPPNLGDISPDGSAHPVITSVESSFLRQGPTFQPPHTSFPGQANQPVMPPPQMTQNFPLPPPQQLQQQMQRPPLQQVHFTGQLIDASFSKRLLLTPCKCLYYLQRIEITTILD
ncbi:unnamed protein product [Protopolystoma xenopodis]|uniref:Uncharacterized protein n=1 Tax=Protopolystoma xenopodis TaxID=117903 RepID=A0A448X936_9PLAT|nr:unnamed protein product [Protopolystoma xenopodis]